MAKVILKKKATLQPSDEEAPKGKLSVKKFKKAQIAPDDDGEEDDQVLAQSRPKTAKDRNRVLPKANSDAKLVAKGKAALEAEEEEDEEETPDFSTEDAIDAYLADEKAKLMRYGGIKLTPRKISKFGVTEKGLRRATVPGIEENEDEMVKVTMLRTLDPAPTIGNVSIVRDHGHEKLISGENYLLPEHCAKVLADSRACAIHD